MWNKRRRGFTLVEMIIAMVIISVGLAGVLSVLSRTAVTSTDPMIAKQMTAIADGMMEEIQLKPFLAGPGGLPANGCNRSSFDDVDDYNGYGGASGIPVCNIDGSPGPAGYTVRVQVVNGAGGILSGGIPASDTRQITVTVQNGGNSYQLVGWRSNFGGA
ncbi:prepilin-type N-terminal cleavage/methylation domain-containing protein [Pseudoduganella violaceinigra]|uniref:prepilin-type N-terminal cleavage/methylation domain-containing protein n=1 Tax=Pseudoduganella violaceinigra TaxID=246602 RepID=UPI00040D569A|nr:prepilin-type N-terminal cleavage/methylation domain-containing protein [Pseudoduganella violaceinigra]